MKCAVPDALQYTHLAFLPYPLKYRWAKATQIGLCIITTGLLIKPVRMIHTLTDLQTTVWKHPRAQQMSRLKAHNGISSGGPLTACSWPTALLWQQWAITTPPATGEPGVGLVRAHVPGAIPLSNALAQFGA